MKALTVSTEDQLLATRCSKQDRGALEELSSLYGNSLYGFLRSALGQRSELAHPHLVEAFVETVRRAAALGLKAPLHVTLLRYLLEGLRKNLKQKHAEGPWPGLDRKLSVLFLSLSRLPWEERVLLLLRDQMNCSLEEIEAVLSKPETEIRSQLQRTRLHFREQIHKTLKNKSVL